MAEPTTAAPGPLVAVRTKDGVATIALDSPHNRNALSARLVRELFAAVDAAEADDGVRVLVLTHTGGTFCAGFDMTEANVAGPDPGIARGHQMVDLMDRIVGCTKPVVGLVDGHVRAGGVGLVAACDIVIAGPRSTFALTEVRLGLAPSVISLTVLPRLADRAAYRLLLTGETIDAAEAARVGLATEAVAEGVDAGEAVERLLSALQGCSPQGLRETKALLTADLRRSIAAERDRVVEQSARLFASDEAREGMTAFLERRPPRWAR